MLTPKDGTPKALRKLLDDQLLPLMMEAPPAKIRLAGAEQDEEGSSIPKPPDLPGHQHFFAETCFCLAGAAESIMVQRDKLTIQPGILHGESCGSQCLLR